MELIYQPPDGNFADQLYGVKAPSNGIYTDDEFEMNKFHTPNKYSRRGSGMSLPEGRKRENGGIHSSMLSLPTPTNQKRIKANR